MAQFSPDLDCRCYYSMYNHVKRLKDLTRDFAPICLLGGLPALKMNLTGFLVAYCQAPGKITSANTENVFMLTM
ncbi:uncharacterized protein LOC119171278 isoform X3 [Rhipicephalus microplus]|uniref:uncharacterized protein LOC119171278 isoform X3 n=1 Tax=Rhipicephalus microplus TaxID=6941 RepID=UPI003F6BE688